MTIPSFQIHFQWRPVLVEKNSAPYEFPSRLTPFLKTQYSSPAVYRWYVVGGEPGPCEAYIGEAADLARRIQRVLTPGTSGKKGSTNKRLRQSLDASRAAGKHVFLSYLDFNSFELNGVLLGTERLGEPFFRRSIEQIVLYLAQVDGHPLLNHWVDQVERAARIFKVPPDALRKALGFPPKRQIKPNAETN